jgi:hypothetical protein
MAVAKSRESVMGRRHKHKFKSSLQAWRDAFYDVVEELSREHGRSLSRATLEHLRTTRARGHWVGTERLSWLLFELGGDVGEFARRMDRRLLRIG